MINLFENYDSQTVDLEKSLHNSGFKHKTVVLQDNGFLPNHVHSPLSFFSGRGHHRKKSFKTPPLFFNEVKVPYYWEIRGDSKIAEIYSGYKKVGKINYSRREGDYRIVSSVEWYNAQNRIRQMDLYNQYGHLFGKKTFSDGDLSLTTYFDIKGSEVVLHNHITNIIQLNWKNKVYFFEKYIDFILFYLEEAKFDISQIFYNHLGNPYFITNALQKHYPDRNQEHTLFWQESTEKIPDNMWQIITAEKSSTRKIIVQSKEEYIRIKEQLEGIKTHTDIKELGYLYELSERKKITHSALIVTHSDNIEHLEQLADLLPNMEFNIAARTTMSEKLLSYGKKENINLYQLVSDDTLQKLLKESSFYFDINYGGMVEDILRKAFENNQLIVGFTTTVHDKRYVNRKNIFRVDELDGFTDLVNDKGRFVSELIEQQKSAGQETVKRYKEVIN